MEYSISVLGLCLEKTIEEKDFYNTQDSVIYNLIEKQIGILIVKADSELDAIISVVKNCAKHYDTFSKYFNQPPFYARYPHKPYMGIPGISLDHDGNAREELVTSERGKQMEELITVPEWLFDYFRQRYVLGTILNFQTLNYKVLR